MRQNVVQLRHWRQTNSSIQEGNTAALAANGDPDDGSGRQQWLTVLNIYNSARDSILNGADSSSSCDSDIHCWVVLIDVSIEKDYWLPQRARTDRILLCSNQRDLITEWHTKL